MDIEQNAALLQSLIVQLSLDTPRSSAQLQGEPEKVLAGLRELYLLQLIEGCFVNGQVSDPLGFQWISATDITLTKRGAALKPL